MTYFFAFTSLNQQVLGLYGSKGIFPIAKLKEQSKNLRIFFFPTLFLWNSSDSILKIAAWIGIGASLFGFMGFFSVSAFIIAWVLYLSFYTVGYPFLSFQWDALLIETGFIAIFYSIATPPPVLLQISLWMLLFRLMLSSGLVKLHSGCPSWRSFCALEYHFETQPLPNIGGFFAFHLNKYVLKTFSFIVFILEILVPFIYFGTPEMRLVASFLTIFFQVVIIVTGNYAFFNLLTITLCVPLIDDQFFNWLQVRSFQMIGQSLTIPLNFIGALIIVYNVVLLIKQFLRSDITLWGLRYFRSIGILNTYGLFAFMTIKREEIIIEGSQDGIEWKEYVFKYKPGIANKGVRQIAPLQPRLDWQMWFAALSDFRAEDWFQSFIYRLLEGSPDVIKLLKDNPFPKKPPKYIRAQKYLFSFNTFEKWRKTGNFWDKKWIGTYMPKVQL